MVFFVGVPGKSSFAERLEPKLGLDLIGGTRVTYSATTMDGSDPPAEQLEEARQIIESRVNALGVSEAEVVIEATGTSSSRWPVRTGTTSSRSATPPSCGSGRF